MSFSFLVVLFFWFFVCYSVFPFFYLSVSSTHDPNDDSRAIDLPLNPTTTLPLHEYKRCSQIRPSIDRF